MFKHTSFKSPFKDGIHGCLTATKIISSYEFLPSTDKVCYLTKEEPEKCLARVLKNHETTKLLESMSEVNLKTRDIAKIEIEALGLDFSKICNLKPEKIFFEDEVKKLLLEFVYQLGFIYIPDLFHIDINERKKLLIDTSKLTLVITELLWILELIGFRREKSKKYRSRIHDVSHTIYASQSDFFIVHDSRLKLKTIAVYSFLGIATKVLDKEEFMSITIS